MSSNDKSISSQVIDYVRAFMIQWLLKSLGGGSQAFTMEAFRDISYSNGESLITKTEFRFLVSKQGSFPSAL